VYDFEGILNTLDMSASQFRDVCVLAGTDYNKGVTERTPVGKAMDLHALYRKNEETIDGFFDWCESNGHLGANGNAYKLFAIGQMFELGNYSLPAGIGPHTFRSGPIAVENMERVLGPIGFVFLPGGR
jgi:hypothetical protein